MKKMLSITTALASLVTLYGVGGLADISVEAEQNKQNATKEVEQSKQNSSKSNSNNESDSETSKIGKAKTKLDEREKRICNKSVDKDGKSCGCKHDVALNEGPRITLGGGVNSQFYTVSDDKTYHVIPGKFSDQNAPFGEFSNGNVGDYSKTYGTSTDAILHIRGENTNYDLNLVYGADLRLNIPVTKAGGMRSRGAYIFAYHKAGDLTVGFNEGAESIMRLDASKIAAGDGGADSSWFKKANLEGEKGNFPFHVAPRLYSESLFSESNWLSFRDGGKHNKSFIDTQPFRLSYYSPTFMGLKFGVSYSPNYDNDLFATGGSQKVQYIDPTTNLGTNVNVNANVLNYKWYNTANAALKAAEKLKDINAIDVAADLATSQNAARDTLAIAENLYNEARAYNTNLPEIPAAIVDTASVGAAVGNNIALVIPDVNIRDLATNIVAARQQNLVANPAGGGGAADAARVAARETVINTGKAISRVANLAATSANTDVNVVGALPAGHAAIAEVDKENTAINAAAGANPGGHMTQAIALGAAAAADAPPDASTNVRNHAQNAAIAAFRAAATAQSALGVNIGTAKEVYMLLATSGNYVGPNYENIISGGVSYEYDFDDFKIKVSATGETGKVKEIKNNSYSMYGEYNDLSAFNVGLAADYNGIKFAASYANLGKSGQPKRICTKNANNNYDCTDANVKKLQENTYYWTAGAGYEFGDIYVSGTYFKSKSVDANELSDIILGAQYNLSSTGSKNSFVPYVTWHHFTTKEKDLPNDKKNNAGNIFLAGVKFTF